MHNLRAPDAVQAATALVENASGFITNDPAFRRIDGLAVLLLDDLRGV
jgi:predicted nucleic acid-binding protein